MSFIRKCVTLQIFGAFAEYLAGLDVVLHDRLHPVFLDRTDLHANAASRISCHYRLAPSEVELVLLYAAIPELLSFQCTAGTASNAHLTQGAILVHAVIYGFIVRDFGIGKYDLQACPRPESRRK